MFGIFKKNPLKKLKDEYAAKLKDAMIAQRSGDIFKYSELSKDADIDTNVAAAKAHAAVKESRLNALDAEASSLRERLPIIEDRAVSAETSKAELELKAALLGETIKATEALLKEAKDEAKAAEAERDAQMTAVAKSRNSMDFVPLRPVF